METNFGQHRLSRRQFLGTASRGAALLGLGSVAAACGPLGGSGSEGVSIRFITPGDLGLERKLYKGFIREFEEQNPDIKVSVTFEAWEDYMTKLPTLLAGGAVPDVIHQHISIVQDYGQRGALEDLTPYMEQDGVKPGDYVPALFDAFSNEGKVFGIPKDSAAWGIYYNKDKFDEAGLDYPADDWTLQDLRELARELTLDERGRPASDPGFEPKNIKQWGFTWMEPTPTLSENARAFVRAFGGDWYNEEYTETLITKDPAVQDFTMFHEMRCEDHSTPSPAQDLGQGDPFRAGLTAMQVGFHSMDYFAREENVDFEYDVTFTPSGPGRQFVAVGASGWAIPRAGGNKDAAWELVKYLTSEQVQKKIGRQERWGVSRRGAIDAIVPEDPISGFTKVHVDPLEGQSDRETISFKFPANQSRIKEIYATHFDPIWTCNRDNVPEAAASTKEQVEATLAES